jgi:hypothetical protein
MLIFATWAGRARPEHSGTWGVALGLRDGPKDARSLVTEGWTGHARVLKSNALAGAE